MSKESEIQALEQAYTSFRDRIVSLPDDAYSEIWLGEWNLSQLLAHMAGWFRQMKIALQRVTRGERPTPDGVDWNDVELWNRRFASEASPVALPSMIGMQPSTDTLPRHGRPRRNSSASIQSAIGLASPAASSLPLGLATLANTCPNWRPGWPPAAAKSPA